MSADPDPQALLMGQQARALRESFERIMHTRERFTPAREATGTQTEPIFFRSARASFLNDTSDRLDALSESLDRLERDDAAAADDDVMERVTQAAVEGSVTPLKERAGVREQVEQMMRALQLVRSDLLKLLNNAEEVSRQARSPASRAASPVGENEPLREVEKTEDDDALLDISRAASVSASRDRLDEDSDGAVAPQGVDKTATGAVRVKEEVEDSVVQDSLDVTLGAVAKWLVNEVRCDLEEELADKDPVSFDFRAFD